MSSERDDARVDGLLEELFPEPEGPAAGAHAATVDAVRRRFGRRPGLRIALRAAAAALLLAAGFAAGSLFRPGPPNGSEPLPAGLAAHERTVFATVRESLGEELRWLASRGGEVLVGLSPVATERPLRVVFVETRSETGEWLARTRVVLPEDEPVRVAFPDAPALELTAGAGNRVACAVEFPDGSRLTSAGARAEPGRRTLIGQVATEEGRISVYVAAF